MIAHLLLATALVAPPDSLPGVFVSTAWLSGHLGDPSVVIVHVDRDRKVFDAGHLPGARFLPLGAIVVTRDGLPNELPPVAQLDSVFESLGVTNESRVVFYGDPLGAARAFFTLDVLGHGDRAAILDGGLAQWRAEGRAVTTMAPVFSRGNFIPAPRTDVVVSADEVNRERLTRAAALLDARPQDEYTGLKAGEGVPRPGHIPTATNLFWQTLLVDGGTVLRPRDELTQRFAAAGAGGQPVVTYCRTGVQASYLYAVARHLGLAPRLYDGSFIEWSRRGDLPVTLGPNP
ncbi:MAG: sulfurtransferase [Gemmatimonadota bacterium]